MGHFLFTAGIPLLIAQVASANGVAPVAAAPQPMQNPGQQTAAQAVAEKTPIVSFAPVQAAAIDKKVTPAPAQPVAPAPSPAVALPIAPAPAPVAAGQGAQNGTVQAANPVKEDPLNAYRDLLMATNELWFLLSGIRDKADADKAAGRFGELVSQVSKMDDDLVLMGDEPQQQESLDQLRYQIMDAYCSVDSEFGGLCRVRCYGSQELVDAFQSAVAGGMFDADDLPLLEIHQPFSREEARQEIARIKRLVAPDKALLECLRRVKDSSSARRRTPELMRLTKLLSSLRPDSKMKHRNFHNADAPAVREVSEPVETLLWGIRSEIVRIAGLPGYSDEPYDSFSDSLDKVYEALGETHSEWFDDVFDESFRIDLDEAYRENSRSATTSN